MNGSSMTKTKLQCQEGASLLYNPLAFGEGGSYMVDNFYAIWFCALEARGCSALEQPAYLWKLRMKDWERE